MFLHSIASAFPPYRYTQAECWDALVDAGVESQIKPRSLSLLEKVLKGDGGIESRHFAVPEIQPVLTRDAQQLNAAFEEAAPALSKAALQKALEKAGLKADELDALFICTCTGYLCPGVTSYVAEQMDMRPDVYLADLVGLGCGAAIPVLRAAHGFAAANPDAKIAVVAVEVCSAAFYVDNDPGVLISLCLFGDGASASIWSAKGGGWQIGDFDTIHVPAEREKIRFINRGGKLCNQLHKSVPCHAADAVAHLRSRHGEGRIIAHSGGRDVIEAIEAKLPGTVLVETRAVLKERGNLSSPSVLVALEQALEADKDDSLWLTAFGAGFAAHSASIRRG